MWDIDLHLIENWIREQSDETIACIAAAVELLGEWGPSLGRPLGDTIKGSKINNLKELRPASPQSSEIRILFVFDPMRNAVMLLAGDKAKGLKKRKWSNWYKKAVPEAELRYEKYLEELNQEANDETLDNR